MTKLTLNNDPDKKPSNATGRKKPVRRGDPTLRDRSKAPAKPPRENNTSPADNGGNTQRTERNERTARRDHANNAPARKQRPANAARNNTHTQPAPRNEHINDQRTKQRPNRDEPQYRQAPRRGGKARDGYDATTHKKPSLREEFATSSNDDLPRLSKVMSERGICSRREADIWIENHWVMVDGEIIEQLGTRIRPDAEIVISRYAEEQQDESATILLHKPVGYVSGQAEDGYEPAIVLVHPDNEWLDDPDLPPHMQREFQRRYLKGLAPAGRLDIDSTGLLVLTQDGRVARHLIGEDSKVEKEYLVRVEGELIQDGLAKLNHGLSLDGVPLKPAKVSWQNEEQLRFVLREGKKRQIRRMCEMVGLHVVGLKRVRIGSVTLSKLPVGQWRYLRSGERF